VNRQSGDEKLEYVLNYSALWHTSHDIAHAQWRFSIVSMSTWCLTQNISETVRDSDLGPKDHQWKMTHGESNGHVTDDVTWPWKVKGVTPICLGPSISETAVDRDLMTMVYLIHGYTLCYSVRHIWALAEFLVLYRKSACAITVTRWSTKLRCLAHLSLRNHWTICNCKSIKIISSGPECPGVSTLTRLQTGGAFDICMYSRSVRSG